MVWPEYHPRIGHNCGEVSPRRRRLRAAILEIGSAPPLHLDGRLGLDTREKTGWVAVLWLCAPVRERLSHFRHCALLL